MDLIEILSNPVRVQVMQYLQIHGEATTKQISEAIPTVPAPTLYRHINTLLKEELLLVKEERRVRGSLERLLALNKEKFASIESGISDLAYQFLMELYSRFQRYSLKADADPRRDRLSLRTRILNLSDQDFDELLQELGALMAKYGEKNSGKVRSLSFVSAPVEEDGS